MKQVIYETKGRAREFCELAINLYTGCGHKCIYCYGATVTHQDKAQFDNEPHPRVTLDDIERSAAEWHGSSRRVLLCFVTDPYQPIESETKLTRQTIEILHKHKINVVILTKGGLRATTDFDLLTPQDAFATTLTCLHGTDSIYWEPGAALPHERIASLQVAKRAGIETWVSLEPVIYTQDAFNLVQLTQSFVGHYKVGTMNYHPHGKSINWQEFGWRMKGLMDGLGVKYYFKKDLLREMGSPANFKQTWECGEKVICTAREHRE